MCVSGSYANIIGDEIMDCTKVNLKRGSKGKQVGELQTYLRACKFYNREIDDDFGKFTEDAVKLLQNKQDNTRDGHFGPKTCSKSDLNMSAIGTSTSQKTSTSNVKELLIYFRKQPDIVTCGPASLSMVFSYYDVNVSIETLRKLCKTDKNGTTPVNLVAAVTQANKNFVLVEEDCKNFDQLISHIDKNNPMVIQLQTIPELGYLGSFGHYVALTGYNRSANTVKIADPSRTIKWFGVSVLKKTIDKRLALGKIQPVKILKKK
jgi:peptidoglycan hydrolase-like protein with peptidoglycan-binding domain